MIQIAKDLKLNSTRNHSRQLGLALCFGLCFGLYFAIAALGCVHREPLTEVKAQTHVHKQTGVEIPNEVMDWTLVPDSGKTGISPEILYSESFLFRRENLSWQPTANVFILRESTTSNLKVIENQVRPNLENLKFLKTEVVKLKNKKRVILSSYLHSMSQTQAMGSGSKSLKVLHHISYFATPEKDSKAVVWVTLDQDAKGQTEVAMNFVEKVLFPILPEVVSSRPPASENKKATKKTSKAKKLLK